MRKNKNTSKTSEPRTVGRGKKQKHPQVFFAEKILEHHPHHRVDGSLLFRGLKGLLFLTQLLLRLVTLMDMGT